MAIINLADALMRLDTETLDYIRERLYRALEDVPMRKGLSRCGLVELVTMAKRSRPERADEIMRFVEVEVERQS